MPARRAALAWLEREHVFKWLPFVPVQALLVFLLLPFVLLVYLSLVSWRITRGVWWHAPFVGAANFTVAHTLERPGQGGVRLDRHLHSFQVSSKLQVTS